MLTTPISQAAFGELPDLATTTQVADYTQTSVPTLARWRMEGQGPKFVKLGWAVRYRKADVLAWLDSLSAEVGS